MQILKHMEDLMDSQVKNAEVYSNVRSYANKGRSKAIVEGCNAFLF